MSKNPQEPQNSPEEYTLEDFSSMSDDQFISLLNKNLEKYNSKIKANCTSLIKNSKILDEKRQNLKKFMVDQVKRTRHNIQTELAQEQQEEIELKEHMDHINLNFRNFWGSHSSSGYFQASGNSQQSDLYAQIDREKDKIRQLSEEI